MRNYIALNVLDILHGKGKIYILLEIVIKASTMEADVVPGGTM